jgi:hypothetical protein
MDLVFRKNASGKEKLYTLFVLAIAGCSIFGFFTDFHPSYSFLWSWPPWIVIVAFSAILSIPVWFDTHPANKAKNLSPLKKAQFYLAVLFLYSIVGFGFFGIFVPSVYTGTFGQPFKQLTEVERKSNGHRRGCDNRIYTDFVDGKVCVSRRLYHVIEAGDRVIIEGVESRFGQKIYSVSKYRQLPSDSRE